MGRGLHENARIVGDRTTKDFIGCKTRGLHSWEWMVFVVVIVGHCHFSLPATAAATDPRDLQVLTYIQQNYSSWTALWPASLGPDPCTNWTGVRCNDLGRVVSLDASTSGLSGPIPPKLGNLSSLAFLDLSSNNLSGTIPRELGNLFKAVQPQNVSVPIVDVSSNFLKGDIPPEWGNLSNTSVHRLYLNCFNETRNNSYQPGQRDPTTCATIYPELGRCTPPQVPSVESSTGCVPMVRFVATFTCNRTDNRALRACDFGIEDTLSQLANKLKPQGFESCCSSKQVVAVALNDNGGQNATFAFNLIPLGDSAFSPDVLQAINNSAKVALQQRSISPGTFNPGPVTLVEQPQQFPPPPPPPSPVTVEPLPPPPPPPTSSPSSPLGVEGVIGVSLGSVLFVAAVIGLIVWRQWRMQSMQGQLVHKGGKREDSHGFRNFTLQELKVATNNFSEENRLGRGGFGEVFRGVIKDETQPNGTRVVAIKRAAARGQPGDTVQAQRMAAEQLVQEFKLLDTVYHRYLLRSVGYCIEGNEGLFVSEFMPNGSLGDVLKSPASRKLLFWKRRRDIAYGTANALNYLHSSCRPPILHNDIKPANVLLDEGWEPRLADFGLAKETGLAVGRRDILESGGDGSVTVGGVTRGYAAPEILRGGRATPKSDVFSFGCLVLVVLSSNPPSPHIDEEVLRLWHEGKGHLVFDLDMDGLDQTEGLRFLQVALLCMQQTPSLRPTMSEVCNMLQGLAVVPDPPVWGPMQMPAIRQHSPEASSVTNVDTTKSFSVNTAPLLDPLTLDFALRETDVFSANIPPR